MKEMTDKEFYELKPGDKVITIYDDIHKAIPNLYPKVGTVCTVIRRYEDEHGNWVVVKWDDNISTILSYTVEVLKND